MNLLNDFVFHGDNVPNWRRQIFLGLDATTQLSGAYHQCMLKSGSCEVYHDPNINGGGLARQYQGELSMSEIGFIDPGSGVSDVADDRARSKFLSNYIKATNTFRGGNFLAEIRETIHMLRHPVTSLFNSTLQFAKRVQKLKRVPVKHLKKTVGDAWLTWAFGVQPLIADCNDAADALNRVTNARGGTGHDTTIIVGHGHDVSILDDSVRAINFVVGDPGSANQFRFIQKVDYDVRYRACIRARLESGGTALEQFGLSPYDFAPAVVEAIPFSFLVDYFLNVTEVVDSCRLASADVSWCYRSVRNARTYNCIPVGYLATPTSPGNLSGGGFYTLVKHVNRVPSGIPYPSFHFQIPGIDSKKWFNIAALTNILHGK